MKIMFASDIHGSSYYSKKIIDIFNLENPEKLIILGDILYHGPRNDFPRDYSPKKAINDFNSLKDYIICVRGNCDSEVDQMVLEFPIMSDFSIFSVDGLTLFLTHGHIYNKQNLPLLNKGDILINGHFHIPTLEKNDNYYYINPGSISLPKENNKNSYMIYENKCFTIKDIEGNILKSMKIE